MLLRRRCRAKEFMVQFDLAICFVWPGNCILLHAGLNIDPGVRSVRFQAHLQNLKHFKVLVSASGINLGKM